MNKLEAVRIISKCANIYKKRLDGYQIVFVYRDENNLYWSSFRPLYRKSNRHYYCMPWFN